MLFASQAGVDEKENRWWLSSPVSQPHDGDGNSSQEVLAQVYEEILAPVNGKDPDRTTSPLGQVASVQKKKGVLGRDGSWRVNMLTPSTTPMRPRPTAVAKPVRVSSASPLATRSSARSLPNVISSTVAGAVDASLYLASPIQLSSSPIAENNASFMKGLMGGKRDKGKKKQGPSPVAAPGRSSEAASTRAGDRPHGEEKGETPMRSRPRTHLPFPIIKPTTTAASKDNMKESNTSTSSVAEGGNSVPISRSTSSKRPRSMASPSKDLDKGPAPKKQRTDPAILGNHPEPSPQSPPRPSSSVHPSSAPIPPSKHDTRIDDGQMSRPTRPGERKNNGSSLRHAFTREQTIQIQRTRLEWLAKFANNGSGEVADRARAKHEKVAARFGNSVLPVAGGGELSRDQSRSSVGGVGGVVTNSALANTPAAEAGTGTSPVSSQASPRKLAPVPTLPLSFEFLVDDEGDGGIDWNRSRELTEAVRRDLKLGKKPTLPALLCTRSQDSQE